MPILPQPSLSQMDMAYTQGAEAHKCATETATVSVTKYTDKQLVHLLAFCGLTSRDKDLLPEIWTHLQSTKSWHDAATELTKWFSNFAEAGDVPVQFHKELVDEIRKMMFFLGATPMADNSHRGITPLAFTLLTVGEENQLREDQEASA